MEAKKIKGVGGRKKEKRAYIPKHMVAQMYILAADQVLTEFQILLLCTRDCTFLCDPSSCSDSTNPQQSPGQAPLWPGQLDFTKAEQEPMVSRTHQGEIY